MRWGRSPGPFLLNNLTPIRKEEGVKDLLEQPLIDRGARAQLDPGIAFLGPGVDGKVALGKDDNPRDPKLISMTGDGKGGDGQGIADGPEAEANDTVVQEVSDVSGVAQKLDLMGPEVRSQ